MTTKTRYKQIDDILNDSEKMTKIIQAGVNRALLHHKRIGNPVCEWRNGHVVWIPAEKISVPDK